MKKKYVFLLVLICGFISFNLFSFAVDVPIKNENVAYANETNENTIYVGGGKVKYEFVSANYIFPFADKLAVRVSCDKTVCFNYSVKFNWTNGKSTSSDYTSHQASLHSDYENIIDCNFVSGYGLIWGCNNVQVTNISFTCNNSTYYVKNLKLYFA